MWVYLFNVITIPIYAFFIKDRKKFVLLVALQLFLISALRSITVGVDLDNYSAGYEYIKDLDFGDLLSRLRLSGLADIYYAFSYENGYVVLNWFSAHMGLSFHGFMVLCSVINIGAVSLFVYKYSKKPWISFVIFSTFGFLPFTFGILRQSLAIAMILFSYMFLDKNKKIYSLLFFLIAFSFHRTAILCLPLLLLAHKKRITKKVFSISLCVGVPIVLLLSRLFYSTVVVSVLSIMRREQYIAEGISMNNMLLLLIIIAVIVMIFFNFQKIKERVESTACYALLLAVCFSILSLYSPDLSRVLPFFNIFLLILIPDVLEQYKEQKYVILVSAAVYFLLFGFMCYNLNGSAIVPYVVYEGGLLW